MLYQTENPHGGDVYAGDVVLDFSANINPLGTPPGVLAAMCAALRTVEQYPDPYCRELVTALAALEGVAREEVICGNGAAELIYAYCAALRPGRAVEVAPTFSEYASALEQNGGRMERYMLRPEDGFALDERFLDFLEEARPEAVFLCNPNNPTGRLIAPETMRKILECCGRLGARVFLDECFLDLAEGGMSVKGALRQNPHVFILKAFTKSYGMAGVRLGYGLCADAALLRAMGRAVQPWNVSSLAQSAGLAALRAGAFLARAREVIFKERRWLQKELEACGYWVCPSAANYLLFSAEPGLGAALMQRGIALRSCANYAGLGAGWYRTAVRQREENEQLIAAIRAARKEETWQRRS